MCRLPGSSLFGDGERDQAHCRIGEACEHGRLFIAGAEHFGDGTDHAQLWLGIEQGERVQAVLRAQGVAHLRVVQRHRADGPGGVVGEQVIDVDGLMRAMEGAGAQVDDADGGVFGVVVGSEDGGR